ncbi:radical SAM protein [bacterium]|nr:radical SAM protein [bacterium]
MNNILNEETFLYETVDKKDASYNVWLAFPGSYPFSMSSLGHLWLFKCIDELEDVNIERICADTERTQIMPKDVNMLGFSLSFDYDFINIFKILETYNISAFTSERDENTPLIFAGGPVLTSNPAPYKDIFDFMIIGDGEELTIQAVNLCKKMVGESKVDILKALSEIDGIFVPLFPKDVNKCSCKVSSDCVFSPILTERSFFKNTLIIEIARGCANRCGFCIASYINLPARFAPFEKIKNIIDKGLEHTNKIALLGALISAHPDFEKICEYIRTKRQEIPELELSVSSLRVDSVEPEVVKTLVECGQKHATIAIEAGSERLRKVINKNVTNEQIFNTVDVAQKNGLKGLKIYAMIGVPTETQEDLDAMLNLAKDLKNLHKGFDLSFGFSTFVPKPHTPFQWCAREDIKSLEKKQNYLKKEFHKMGVKANFSSAKWDYYQALLSRGDEKLGKYIYEVYKNGANLGALKSVYKDFYKSKLLPDSDYYALREIPTTENLPWDFIKINPGKDFLKQEHDRLLNIS